MLKDLPITEARHELTSLPERLRESHETVTVTRRGRPVLAILPWEEYEALIETLEIAGDAEMMAALRQGIKEAREGKGIPWERAKRKLGL
jgi:prevent-host-death family protein